MADDCCKTSEACSDEASSCEFTGGITYDGPDLSCEADAEFSAPAGTKLNVMLALIWAKLCAIVSGGGADGAVTNVELNTNSLDFTGVGTGFNGSIDLSKYENTNDIDYVSDMTINGNDITVTGVGNAFNGVITIPSAGAIADLSTYQGDVNITSATPAAALTGSTISNIPAGRYLACATINIYPTQTAIDLDTHVIFGIYNNGTIVPGSQMTYWIQKEQSSSKFFRETYCYSVQLPITVLDLTAVDLRANTIIVSDGMVITGSDLTLTLIKIS